MRNWLASILLLLHYLFFLSCPPPFLELGTIIAYKSVCVNPFFKFFSRIFQNSREPLEFQRKKFAEKPRGGGENRKKHPNNLYIHITGPRSRTIHYIRGCHRDPQTVHGESLDLIGRRGRKKEETTESLHPSYNRKHRNQLFNFLQ